MIVTHEPEVAELADRTIEVDRGRAAEAVAA